MTRFRHSRGLASMLAGLALTVLAGTAGAQQGTIITGTVKSEQGQPLQGANVVIAELNVSVGTNEQGVYRITLAPERARGQTVPLRVRAIGFQPQVRQIALAGGTITQNFDLKIDINKLSEVVVTGVTGATETKKLAFTVDKVDAGALPVPPSSALQSLQGKVTGAQIVMPSGRPGTAPSIVLRGAKSLNLGLSPLIVVDGVLMSGSMSDINPSDIESIEVVKGAAASSTYGSRAQNGVISITTKSGRDAGQGARFAVRSEYGFSDIQGAYPFAQKHWMLMDPQQRNFCIVVANQPACSRIVDFEAEAFRVNDQGPIVALNPYQFERDAGIGRSLTKPQLKGFFQINEWPVRYDPIAQAVTAGVLTQNNADMSGRFGNTGFFASVGNTIQEGAIRNLDGYRRNSARLNLDQQVGEELTMALQTFYSRSTTYPDGEFFRLTRSPAGVDLLRRDSQGRLFVRSNPLDQGQQNENPLYNNQSAQGRTEADRYLGSFTTRYTPFTWLDLESNLSLDRRRSDGWFLTEKGTRTTGRTTAYLGGYSESAAQDESYNFSLRGSARQTNLLGISDLQTRLNVNYSFERSDDGSIGASGGTLVVPGLLTLRNVTVPNAPSSSSTSTRAMGILFGVAADYKGKYIADAVLRRDGSSLFGAAQRWHPYYRWSLAWRLSDEGFFPMKGALNDLKLRASVGTAGGRPGFSYQYETFTIGTGGTISSNQLGNRFLKPEHTTETELGVDAEILSKYGLNVTWAKSITDDIMLSVPSSSSSGFSSQWRNAGQITNKTWEISLNVPIVTNRDIVWTSRLSYDRNRSVITRLDVPNFSSTTNGARFEFRPGERLGQVWGKYFLTDCSQLPSQFASQCGGPGSQYQKNDEGYIVWTGGLLPSEGITRNAWQAALPGCLVNGVAVAQTGRVNCAKAGGVENNPWAIPFTYWGQKIVMRDSTGTPDQQRLGNTSPDFHLSMTQNFSWKKFTVYALVDGNYGNRLHNQEIHWSLGDFMVRYEDQEGKTVESAKPMGYYWRAPLPDHGAGVGGTYDVLGGNNHTVGKGTYTKLRELSLEYQLGALRGVGDWTVRAIGRNLYTITDFLGWDPEVGGTVLNSSAIGATAAFGYPQTRSFTLAIQSRF